MYKYGQCGPPLGDTYSHNPHPLGGHGENYGQGEPGKKANNSIILPRFLLSRIHSHDVFVFLLLYFTICLLFIGQHHHPPERSFVNDERSQRSLSQSLYHVEQQEGERVCQYPHSSPSYVNSSYAEYGYGYGPPQHTVDSAPIDCGGAPNNEKHRQYPDRSFSFSNQRGSESPRQF
jgi:hypothetical protein